MCRTAFTFSNGEQTRDITIQNIGLNLRVPQEDTHKTHQSVPERFSGRTTVHSTVHLAVLGMKKGPTGFRKSFDSNW